MRPEVIELYRLRWRLSEISLYTALFRGEHGDTEDERLSWRGFVGYVRGE